ncbi:MAG TPA: ferritin-like domain-containing protein [Steroidobacteraceae bacterium]|nr:ferritin-like domain-containing protein [Steroidobacteraceae bacterium]
MSANPEVNPPSPSREALIHQLYEAAELEHNLMCTYLYAAFSLKSGVEEGLSAAEAAATARWRRTMLHVAVEEMGHLTAVWNITAALGGSPRFGRMNFPLDPGGLPASVVVRLAPFSEAVLQHFIFLERPKDSGEPDGAGFSPDFTFTRGVAAPRLTPMPIDYETVGAFYENLADNVRSFVARIGEKEAFCGDRSLQISRKEIDFQGCDPVICAITAIKAFDAIVTQGEGASEANPDSHYCRFIAIREELAALKRANPAFEPAYNAAVNPVLRKPVRQGHRVWIENEEAAKTVDLANTAYMLMLRLISHSYLVPRPHPAKALCIDLALGLMRAMTPLAERAARLPAGPSNPDCNAGMSFTALRDAAPLPPGASAGRFFVERLRELATGVEALAANADPRIAQASKVITDLALRARTRFAVIEAEDPVVLSAQGAPPRPIPAGSAAAVAPPAAATAGPAAGTAVIEPGNVAPTPRTENGVDYIEGRDLTLIYEGKKCIHSRFCVTWGPQVFIANVKGPWINPDAIPTEALTEIAHVCVSGAIRYKRKDGKPDEQAPAVNLISIREGGPYAIKADIRLDGAPAGNYRYTLCRCGASKNKPFCDGSHHEVNFSASGEPATGKADMLPVRNGPLEVTPLVDGPLQVRGNMEIISGTGRVVARQESARLCRCGGSGNKPFCDGTHATIGFKS